MEQKSNKIHRSVIIAMVAVHMKWSKEKATLWIDTENPHFGNVKPMKMIEYGRAHKVYEFIDDAKEKNDPRRN